MARRRGKGDQKADDDGGGAPATGGSEREVVHDYPGTGVTAVLIALSLLAVAFIVFLAQNTDSVPLSFLWWELEAPLFVVVLVTLAASAIATLVVAGIWRRRRRRTRTEREELRRLREQRT